MGVAWGARGEVFVVAIGSSCCGDTSESDFEKKGGLLLFKLFKTQGLKVFINKISI